MKSHDPQRVSTPEETSKKPSEHENTPRADSQNDRLTVSRRAALASVVGIGGLSMMSSPAAAAGVKTWKKDRDADGQQLLNLAALTMQANPAITNFEGTGLSIDANGVLNTTATDTRTNVSDDGMEVVPTVEDINFGSNLTVSDDMDHSATIDADTWDTDVSASGNSLTGADTISTDNLSVSNVGVRAEGFSTLSVANSYVRPDYDGVHFDHQSEFNVEEGIFTAADDGFYKVEIWAVVHGISPGERVDLYRGLGPAERPSHQTRDIDEVAGTSPRATYISDSELLQMDAGHVVYAELLKTEGGDHFYNINMHVHQVG